MQYLYILGVQVVAIILLMYVMKMVSIMTVTIALLDKLVLLTIMIQERTFYHIR